MHYSFMIFGHHRIPITGWLRSQSNESMAHATQAGEHITSLGGHPSLRIGPLLETHKHSVDDILGEALEHEQKGLDAYGNSSSKCATAASCSRSSRAR